LKIGDAPPLTSVVDEKALVRFHPLRNAFRVIQTIDADDQFAGTKPGDRLTDNPIRARTHGDFLKVAHVNSDRKAFHAGALSAWLQRILVLSDSAEFLHKSPPKVVGIPLSLHSDEIEIHDGAEKIGASWKWGRPSRK
jgi:hypothetical protein